MIHAALAIGGLVLAMIVVSVIGVVLALISLARDDPGNDP